jgi:hypothetical protein
MQPVGGGGGCGGGGRCNLFRRRLLQLVEIKKVKLERQACKYNKKGCSLVVVIALSTAPSTSFVVVDSSLHGENSPM